MNVKDIIYRREIKKSDVTAIAEIVKSSGFFSAAELDIAIELAEEKLDLGEDSSYQFLFAEQTGFVIGYACWGFIPATTGSVDLYWIAMRENSRGQGLGKKLLLETEKIIRASGGLKIYIETSSREQYQPTRRFYEMRGYQQAAFLEDFYFPGDSKIIYLKNIK
ncbi:MAG TPA: GNAT family N-acetyltransferase [Deltaproteobacteria bacterium]|nr:GNAT family N-acetyltransferase [Deltaproteobacteria bacterium]